MTMQKGDKVEYEGVNHPCCTFCDIPKDHPLILEINDAEMSAEDRSIVLTSSCWRRYLAQWHISEGKLFLSSILGRFKKMALEPIFADWYTGHLCLGIGEEFDSDFMFRRYEKELHFEIENGLVIKITQEDRFSKHNDPYQGEMWEKHIRSMNNLLKKHHSPEQEEKLKTFLDD